MYSENVKIRLMASLRRDPVFFVLLLFSLFPVYFQFYRVGLGIPGALVCVWVFLSILISESPLRKLLEKSRFRIPLVLLGAIKYLYWFGIAVLITAYTRCVVIPYSFLGLPILAFALVFRLFKVISYRSYLLLIFDLFLLMTLLLYRADVIHLILSRIEKPPYLHEVIATSDNTLSCQGQKYDLEYPPVWIRRIHLYENANIITAANDYNFVQERERNVAGLAARITDKGCTLRWFHETFCRDMIYDETRSIYYASHFFDRQILMLDENLDVVQKTEVGNEIIDIFLYENGRGEEQLLALSFLDGKLFSLNPTSLDLISGRVYSPFIMNCNFARMSQAKRVLYCAVFSWGKIATRIDLENAGRAERGVWGIGSWGIDFEGHGDHFYISDFFLGRLYKVDEKSMKVVGHALLRPGIRSVVYDPKRGYIYVGDYYLKNVYVLDEHLRKVCTLRSNGKVTDMALSRDGAYLYTAGWQGIYAIDLLAALEGPERQQGNRIRPP